MGIFPIDVLAMQSRLDELRAGALENEARMVKAQEKIDRERRDVFLAQLREAASRASEHERNAASAERRAAAAEERLRVEMKNSRYWRNLFTIVAVAIGFVTLAHAVAYLGSR